MIETPMEREPALTAAESVQRLVFGERETLTHAKTCIWNQLAADAVEWPSNALQSSVE